LMGVFPWSVRGAAHEHHVIEDQIEADFPIQAMPDGTAVDADMLLKEGEASEQEDLEGVR